MKIHLKQIPPEGLHLEGEEDCPIPELASEETRCIGPMQYRLDVGISGDSLWASGWLSQNVQLSCVACLEKFIHEIKVPNFSVHTELAGPEVVDLTPFMREDILLNLPAHPRCDRERGRICQAPAPKPIPEETKRKADWSALDKLKLKP